MQGIGQAALNKLESAARANFVGPTCKDELPFLAQLIPVEAMLLS